MRSRPSSTKLNRILPVDRYANWVGCIVHLRSELARLGMRQEDLKRYQAEVLQEIEGGLSESALEEMLHWWDYDVERLKERGRHGRPAKPRIEISMYFNQRGNFTLLWEPFGVRLGRPGPDCDWRHWEPTAAHWDSRPTNELLWLRGLRNVENMFRVYTNPPRPDDQVPEFLRTPERLWQARQDRREYQWQDRAVDSILLQAAAALVRQLKTRLEPHFDITWQTAIFMEWQEIKDKDAPLGRSERLLSWDIENVRMRTMRAEEKELQSFRKAAGCTADQLMAAYREVHDRAPTIHSDEKADRVSKLLKKRGHRKATASVVRRWLDLLRKHRNGLFPKAPPPENVVPFKRA